MFTLCSLESIRRNVEKHQLMIYIKFNKIILLFLILAYFKMFLKEKTFQAHMETQNFLSFLLVYLNPACAMYISNYLTFSEQLSKSQQNHEYPPVICDSINLSCDS